MFCQAVNIVDAPIILDPISIFFGKMDNVTLATITVQSFPSPAQFVWEGIDSEQRTITYFGDDITQSSVYYEVQDQAANYTVTIQSGDRNDLVVHHTFAIMPDGNN